MTDRKRNQLVLSLGEGPAGEKLRKAFDVAAKAEGVSLSEWARDVLSAAAGVEGRVSYADRLARLELLADGQRD